MVTSPHPGSAEEAMTIARPAATVPSRPLDLVKTSVARVLGILQSSRSSSAQMTVAQRAAIRRVADDLFDFEEMARRTLAQHWKARSAQEQAEFARVFVDVLERSYLTVIGNFPVAAVTFQGESVEGPYAQVRSRIITDRRVEIPIEYRLFQSGDRWQVYDVVADGVSIVSSYRSQFNTIIRTSSFAELMERLRAREARAAPRQGP
jgi:phospholipid transport system substrate-binding protein